MNPTNALDFFQDFRNVPSEWSDAQIFFNRWILENATFLNSKEIGIFTTAPTPCGKQLFINRHTYDAFRLMIPIGALPNTGTMSYPTGITVDSTFRLVDLYCLANDTNDLMFFRFNYWSIAAGDIKIDLESANVVITTASDYSAYNDCFIILEYVTGVKP